MYRSCYQTRKVPMQQGKTTRTARHAHSVCAPIHVALADERRAVGGSESFGRRAGRAADHLRSVSGVLAIVGHRVTRVVADSAVGSLRDSAPLLRCSAGSAAPPLLIASRGEASRASTAASSAIAPTAAVSDVACGGGVLAGCWG